jgi:uncharacterized membrane protein (DUF441 family)
MRRITGGVLAFTGMAIFLAGFYLFPAGADLFYKLVIDNLAGGDYGTGMRYVYLLCIGMIVGGLALAWGPDRTVRYFTVNPMITVALVIAVILGFWLFPALGGY